MSDQERLIEALMCEVAATGLSEGVFFGPEWAVQIINEYAEETGGWEYWEKHE